jgi:hypothetical protein
LGVSTFANGREFKFDGHAGVLEQMSCGIKI